VGRLVNPLVRLAALALPLQALPLALQPAELFALPLIAVSLARRWRAISRAPVALDYGVLVWTAAVLLAAAVAIARGVPPPGVGREAAVAVFLMFLYAAVRALPADARRGALRDLVISAALASALGAAGSAASALGIETPLAFPADRPYPYLGHAPQARALTPKPNMLASVAMLALVLLISGAARFSPRAAAGLACVVSIGFAATFSKTVLPLAVALAVVWVLRSAGGRFTPPRLRAAGAATLLAGLLYAAGSHLLLLPASADRRELQDEMFTSGAPLREWQLFGRRFVILPTNYLFNKKSSLEAIRRTFPFGLGPGRHPSFTCVLQHERLYPATQWAGAPHSTYFGTPAELGLSGTLGLVVLALAGFSTLRMRFAGGRRGTPLDVAAAGMAAAVLIEAIATDVMHFRHYTWLLALFASGSGADEGTLAQRLEGGDADGGREVQRA